MMIKSKERIFLIGPMGAGKTTIGKALALVSTLAFVDLDELLVKQQQITIPKIFEQYGEPYFRQLETQTLEHALQYNAVIATGGGIVTTPQNLSLLRDNGIVIYLYCDVQQQFERTAHDSNRPMLNAEDKRLRLQQIFEQRDPLYRQISHFIVDSGSGSIHDCVDKIKIFLSSIA